MLHLSNAPLNGLYSILDHNVCQSSAKYAEVMWSEKSGW